jgi:hypothetical protein
LKEVLGAKGHSADGMTWVDRVEGEGEECESQIETLPRLNPRLTGHGGRSDSSESRSSDGGSGDGVEHYGMESVGGRVVSEE